MLGGRGQEQMYFFKNVDYGALPFHTRSLKSSFLKYYFGREGHKKEYTVYTFDNVDNCGRPLNV